MSATSGKVNGTLSYFSRAKDGGRLQLAVVLLFAGVDDQGDVAAAVGGELPEGSDNVVLHGEPATHTGSEPGGP